MEAKHFYVQQGLGLQGFWLMKTVHHEVGKNQKSPSKIRISQKFEKIIENPCKIQVCFLNGFLISNGHKIFYLHIFKVSKALNLYDYT